MRKLIWVLILLWPSLTVAGVINVEFQFTPFVGDPVKADHVTTVPGKASVYINNVMIADSEVSEKEVPVLFEDREIAPSVWVPVKSLGSVLRKGKNNIRIEFEPSDPKVSYRAQLRWAQVTDQVTKVEEGPGRISETNQSGEGVDDKKAAGQVVFEREFLADFADDLPWHHYPPVKVLTEEDKKSLAKIVQDRAAMFIPDFSGAYQMLGSKSQMNVEEIKKTGCIEKGYAAGVRIASQPADQLDLVATGNPEIMVRAKAGNLYYPLDRTSFDRIKDDNVQMCLGMVLSVLYPPRLMAVRTPSGKWEVVY
jgi:hypothetical protein